MEICLQRLKIFIIGIRASSEEFVSKEALSLLASCDGIFSTRRFINYFESLGFKDKLYEFPARLSELPDSIKSFAKKTAGNCNIAVLATGDPNFFGITPFLKKKIPEAEIVVKPNVSTMQEAFSRLNLNWEDAAFFSLHGRQKDSLLGFVLKNHKGFIFTSNALDVLYLLNLLKYYRLDDFKVYIFENIGTVNENLTELSYPFLLKKPVSDLNVVIFVRNETLGSYPGIGLEESLYKFKSGMITKREVRCNAISLLSLKEGDVIWDIGAGSGSVSIEGTFNPIGTLSFAIEKDEEAFQNLKENIKTFSAFNVRPIFSDFEAVSGVLPKPDKIFIGGGKIKSTISVAFEALKENGVMVIALVSVDNLFETLSFIKNKGLNYSLIQISSAKNHPVRKSSIIKSANPVFLVRIDKIQQQKTN